MVVFRNFMAVSTGAVLVLGYGLSTTAQTVSNVSNIDNSSGEQNTQKTKQETKNLLVSARVSETPKIVNSYGGAKILGKLSLERNKYNPTTKEFFLAESPESSGFVNESAQTLPPPAPPSNTSTPEDPYIPNPTLPSNSNNETKSLDASPNPLFFPTKPQEVKIENTQPISLQEALDLALRNNKELQTARLTLEKSRDELKEALAAQYPTLDANLDFNYTDSAAGERGNKIARQDARAIGRNFTPQDTDNTDFNGTVELNYNVYTGGRVGAQIKRVQEQLKFNELDVERISEQLRFETIRDYYELQNADSQVEIEQAAVDDASQTLLDAQRLEKAGLGTKFDVLRAEVELANANQRLTTALANQRTSRRQLVETLNLGQQVNLTAADRIEEAGKWELPLEDSIILAYKNRAELEQFLVRRGISQQDKQIALAAKRPQVSLFANYNLLENLDDSVGISDGYAVGARMQWRLFDAGASSARAEQAKKDNDIEETRFAGQRDTIRFEVEQAYYKINANQDNIRTSEKAVQLATESLRLARLRFQAGVGTQTDVIQAQGQLTTARANYLRAIIQYNQSLNEMQRAVSNVPDGELFKKQ